MAYSERNFELEACTDEEQVRGVLAKLYDNDGDKIKFLKEYTGVKGEYDFPEGVPATSRQELSVEIEIFLGGFWKLFRD